MSYFVIDLQVKRAGMIQHHKLVAPAPVFAAVMFVHALDKKTELGGINGVGLIHRTYRPYIEHIEHKPDKVDHLLVDECLISQRGACGFSIDNNSPKEMSIQPAVHADLIWTLIVSCNNAFDRDSESHVRDTIKGMRFAGGCIERAIVRNFDNYDDAFRPRGGMWIDDATTGPITSAEELLEPLARQGGGKKERLWLAPANLGYATIETPRPRKGSRSECQHAYAEHLLGLVSYTPIHRKPAEEKHLWKHGWVGSQFVVTNRDQPLSATPTFI